MAQRFPSLFLSHGGGPMFFLQPNSGTPSSFRSMCSGSPSEQWYRNFAASQGWQQRPPKAIVIMSAHYEAKNIKVQAKPKPSMYFDYYGFPSETYEYEYPAPGDAALSKKIMSLLSSSNISAELDESRDFDHGVFVPMMLMFPKADIPIVTISVASSLSPQLHYDVGRALAPLRDDGVLLIGSGQATHDMSQRLSASNAHAFVEALDSSLKQPLASARLASLNKWSSLPHARTAHPREEHLVPLFFAAGAAHDDQTKVDQVADFWGGSFSLACWKFA